MSDEEIEQIRKFISHPSKTYALGPQNCQSVALALAVLICDGDGFETWNSLEYLLLFSKSSLIPPLLSLREYLKLSWADPIFLTRAIRLGPPIKKTTDEARPVEVSVNSTIRTKLQLYEELPEGSSCGFRSYCQLIRPAKKG
ncbi:hypothetical protein N7G274_003692 [Stereocaulon virgatum]|uniref:Uncharacterized protein n=1 Tax=Stereocaulon virgatum TaxID=373712 RepID=A0ABR4AEV8_9LECA